MQSYCVYCYPGNAQPCTSLTAEEYEAKIARAERLIGRWYLRTIQEATTDVESTFVIESQS